MCHYVFLQTCIPIRMKAKSLPEALGEVLKIEYSLNLNKDVLVCLKNETIMREQQRCSC